MADLTCTITLDKTAGVAVKIEGGSATQTITLDGTTLTLEVKGSAGGTKIVQTATDVTINCTTFTVEASGNVSIKAGAALKLAGVTEADLGAAMVKVEADSMATIKGNLISAQGQLVKLG
jgi:hypothetical protein